MTLPRSGDAADGVVADVALVVGVDEVLCGAAEGGEGGDEAGTVGGGVDAEEGRGDVGGVVDGPAEGEGALLGWEDAGDDGCDGVAVLVAGMSRTTSLPPLTWMISRSWRRGCQVPSCDWYSAVGACCRGCVRCRRPGRWRRGW